MDGFECFGGKRVRLGRSSGADECLEDENFDFSQINLGRTRIGRFGFDLTATELDSDVKKRTF